MSRSTGLGKDYDPRTSIFTPEGRLYRVELAFKAVKAAGVTSTGVRGTDSVCVFPHKKMLAKLQDKLDRRTNSSAQGNSEETKMSRRDGKRFMRRVTTRDLWSDDVACARWRQRPFRHSGGSDMAHASPWYRSSTKKFYAQHKVHAQHR